MSDIVVVPLRYDGLDAENHELSLDALGESLKGAARVLGVVGNFAVTGRYVSQASAMDVRVVAREPRANCFTLEAVLQFAQQQGLLQGAVAPLVAAVIGWVIAKASNSKEEMKHLAASLDKAIEALAQNNADQKSQILGIIDKIAEVLKPAARQLVAPVGRSCRQLTVGDAAVIDEATADAIRGDESDEVDQERAYSVLLTELDLENRTAKVRTDDLPEKRIRASITDPDMAPYAAAFAAGEQMQITAKAVLRDGEIRALYVSNSL
jgi:hypothetical protein